jgi:DNA helicase HerA-like ATPase
VVECAPSSVRVNLPRGSRPNGTLLHGNRFGAGEVGEYVCVETDRFAILGRINQIRLPERERLSVEPQMEAQPESHPIGTIQLLCSVSIETGAVTPGITEFPRIGASIYSAHPDLLSSVAEFGKDGESAGLTLSIATLAKDPSTIVKLTPEKLFGRHSAILGATGGGKSWTIARIVESLQGTKAKLILLDATGEYHTTRIGVTHVHLGGAQPPATSEEVVLPYKHFSIHDLFAMFRPSGQSQGPKLRAAMKTLKLLAVDPTLGHLGTFLKANQSKANFNAAYQTNLGVVDSDAADFDITKLPQQIEHECCYLTDNQHPNHWGGANGNEIGYCSSLVGRVGSTISAPEFACIFKPGTKKPLFDAIESFVTDATQRVLRISLRDVAFASDARQIVANTIGKYLLKTARAGAYVNSPIVLILDEAHNFINKTIGDEFSKEYLDAFELIAREGRKFCLTICIATQRPRDLPESVLSQMGTMIVHRLTNNSDRELVEKASGDIDRSAASFLPTLAPGEAILIGTDFAFPVSVKILAPACEPDSQGPNYQRLWQ